MLETRPSGCASAEFHFLSLQLTFLVPADWITPWFKFWCAKTRQIFKHLQIKIQQVRQQLPYKTWAKSGGPLVPLRVENDSSLSVDLLGIAAWSQILILSGWMLCQNDPRRSKISNSGWNSACLTCCQDWKWFLDIPWREKRWFLVAAELPWHIPFPIFVFFRALRFLWVFEIFVAGGQDSKTI